MTRQRREMRRNEPEIRRTRWRQQHQKGFMAVVMLRWLAEIVHECGYLS